jgi:plastocyanin
MNPDLFYVCGIALVLAALSVSVVGLRYDTFPSPGLFRAGLVGFLVLVGATTTYAVVQSRHEQKKRNEKIAKEKGGGTETNAAQQPGQPAQPKVKGPGGTLQLAADKTKLAYDTTKLDSKPGKVTIDFTNPSPIQHDVTIAKGSSDIAKSELVAAGNATVSTDLAAGSYVFYCSVPGHRQAGMEGTLTVK